jgi:creatinine amidohydrolase
VHGGELDTSLMLYIAPDLVHMELAQDFALPAGRGGRRYDPALGRELPTGSPGSVGYPSLASAQKGERVYSLILERVSRCLVQC